MLRLLALWLRAALLRQVPSAGTPMAWTRTDPYGFPPHRACVPRFVCGGCLDPCGLNTHGPLRPSATLGLRPALFRGGSGILVQI